MPDWLKDDSVTQLGPLAQALNILLTLCWLGGLPALIGLLLASSSFRKKVCAFPPRPLPSFRFMDLLVTIVMFIGCQSVLVAGLLHAQSLLNLTNDKTGRVALSMLGLLSMYALMLPVLVWLARRRGGPAGSAGFWPVHETLGMSPPRDIPFDVKAGIGTYILMSWLTLAVFVLNKYLVYRLGWKADQNPMIEILVEELAGAKRFWLLAWLTFAATVGVALFEELLFRGLLYNVFKRYAPTAVAAPLAALVFAGAHGVKSQVLPLFVLGLLMTYAYERSGRLLAPIILHATNNGLVMLILLCG